MVQSARGCIECACFLAPLEELLDLLLFSAYSGGPLIGGALTGAPASTADGARQWWAAEGACYHLSGLLPAAGHPAEHQRVILPFASDPELAALSEAAGE